MSPDETLPEPFAGDGVGVETTQGLGELALAQLVVQPAREVVVVRSDPQARLEEVEIDRSRTHDLELFGQLGERARPMAGGKREGHRVHEVELLARGGDAQLPRLPEVALDHVDQPGAEVAQVRELDGVDGRQTLAEPAFLKHVGHPVGEVVRRFRVEVLVLHEEVMGVVEHHRQRHHSQMLEKPGEVSRLPARELRQGEASPEFEGVASDALHDGSHRRSGRRFVGAVAAPFEQVEESRRPPADVVRRDLAIQRVHALLALF